MTQTRKADPGRLDSQVKVSILAACFCGVLLAGCGRTAPSVAKCAVERIAYGDGPQQFGELRLPRGERPYPVAVVIHGGYWQAAFGLDLMNDLSEALVAAGWAVWNIEYRRIGDAGGGWPGTFEDVGQGVDHLRVLEKKHALDLKRVVAIGHSAGGQLALWTAGRPRLKTGGPLFAANPLSLRGVVCLAGVVDLEKGWERKLGNGIIEQLLGGKPTDVPERYADACPTSLLPLGVRSILIHGEKDATVPPGMSQKFQTSAVQKGDRSECILLPGAGHFEVIQPRAKDWPAILRAVQSLR